MAVVDCVFAAVAETPEQVTDWLTRIAGCEVVRIESDATLLRVRAESVDCWLGVVVQPNGYVEVDPEPDEIQAMDPYGIEIQLRGGRTEEVLHAEAGQLFDKLIAARSDVPMLLVHNLDTLVAAHLPGAGTHVFDESITPDGLDIDVWRPWVVS